MIVINRKDEETIDRMIKRYKRKHRDVQIQKQVRARQHYVKPSVQRRNEILNAKYREEKFGDN